MTNRDQAQLIAGRILGDAEAILATVGVAFDNLGAWQPGARSTPTDSAGHGSGDPGDAILHAALAYSRDDVVRARRDAARMLQDLERRMQHLRSLVASWATTAPNPTESADIWCQHCVRHGHRHVHGRYRVGGLVVCEWAFQWAKREGALPDQADVDAHARGRRARRRVEDSRKVVAHCPTRRTSTPTHAAGAPGVASRTHARSWRDA